MKILLFILCLCFFLSPLSSHADSYPRLKAGLWQMDTQVGPMPMSAEYCVDEATQNKLFEPEGTMGACSKPIVQSSGSTYEMQMTCKQGARANTVKTKIVFSGDESFRSETLIDNNRISSNGTYLGRCAANQRPGSMHIKGPGGMNIDLDQVQKMMQGFQR